MSCFCVASLELFLCPSESAIILVSGAISVSNLLFEENGNRVLRQAKHILDGVVVRAPRPQRSHPLLQYAPYDLVVLMAGH